MKQKIVIIGAGPAGLTAAYELLAQSEYDVLVLEATDAIGGISQTVRHNGNRIDIGGHRFFSKSDVVMDWWQAFMPIQGSPSLDDKQLDRTKPLSHSGPDPDAVDEVMLVRDRVSRIFYLRHFFDYPISLKLETFTNMGLINSIQAGFSYLISLFHKRDEISLEDFMINRFGTKLYRMFFENYTYKVWGQHPSSISADWGAQRIKGLSLKKLLTALIMKPFTQKGGLSQKHVETSLIEQFLYPKFGPGQLWETVARGVNVRGGSIRMKAEVRHIHAENGRVLAVDVMEDGKTHRIEGDVFLSSMPVKDLISAFPKSAVPTNIIEHAEQLPYRDFITVGLLLDNLDIKNTTQYKTLGNVVPDCWIYIQEPDVQVGRLQIFNNWSPYMVQNPEHTVWVGMEYFCTEGDALWSMSENMFIDMAVEELKKIGIISSQTVHDSVCIKIKKAYPAYFGSYAYFDQIRTYLDSYKNLYCIGRNGQHRYNNMDHSMLTAMEAVKCIVNSSSDKSGIWSVNTEGTYHEAKGTIQTDQTA